MRQFHMHGRGVIVLRLDNNYSFYEHTSIVAARAEARRLATTVGGTFVVYAPVAIIDLPPAPELTEEAAHPELLSAVDKMIQNGGPKDDLQF